MTENEIKKAVECCFDCACRNCPYKEKGDCEELLKQDLFNLIDGYKKENDRLNAQIAVLQGWVKKEER